MQNQKGNIILWVGLIAVGVILALGVGIGARYYSQKFNNPFQVEQSELSNQIPIQLTSTISTTDQSPQDLGNGWTKDKNQVFYRGEAVTGVDSSSFELLSGRAIVAYIKDKYGIYTFDPNAPYEPNGLQEKLKKIENIDSETFKFFTSDCNLKWCNYYYKDKQKVFYGPYNNTEIKGADSLTFEYVGGRSGNDPEQYTWDDIAKDKNCIYHGDKKVFDINGLCKNPDNCTKDNLTNCLFNSK